MGESKGTGRLRLPPSADRNSLSPSTSVSSAILSRFYALVLPLPAYLQIVLPSALFQTVFTSSDDNRYKSMLMNALVGLDDRGASPEDMAYLKGAWKDLRRDDTGVSMEEIIDRAHSKLLSRSKERSHGTNVLCLGYRDAQKRGETSKPTFVRTGVANFFTNTIVTSLASSEWKLLLERLGPAPLLHILCQTSLFLPLPNGCFYQVCGPLLDYEPERKTSRSFGDGFLGQDRGRINCKNAFGDGGLLPDSISNVVPARLPCTKLSPAKDERAQACRSLSRQSSANTSGSLGSTSNSGGGIKRKANDTRANAIKGPSDIVFVRSRLFYARPVRDRSGKVVAGLPLMHGLNRNSQGKNTPFRRSHGLFSTETSQARVEAGGVPVDLSGDSTTSVERKEGIRPKCDAALQRRALHLLKYIFPRQYGLPNVFVGRTKRRSFSAQTADYEGMEREIKALGAVKTPQRLKCVLRLIRRFIKRHDACNYRRMLSIFCPSAIQRRRQGDESERSENILTEGTKAEILELMEEPPQIDGTAPTGTNASLSTMSSVLVPGTQVSRSDITFDVSHASQIQQTAGRRAANERRKERPKFKEFAQSAGLVSRFAIAVVKNVIPFELWGSQRNLDVVSHHIDKFIRLRRFETLTLHAVLQSFHPSDCEWLLPAKARARSQRTNVAEETKRRELIAELLYWLFDGWLIPLLRTTFYVTESSAYRNRVLYFRQDDWATICRPIVARLSQSVFEPLEMDEAKKKLTARQLGYSYVRLLPKETGVRPIVNLRRRGRAMVSDDGTSLAPSINQILQSAFHILTFEKNRHPNLLGASVLGPNEIYQKLKAFQLRIGQGGSARPKLYFVKVDVRCCFDTIDQAKLLHIVRTLLSEDAYMLQKYSQVVPTAGRFSKSRMQRACPDYEHIPFPELAAELAASLRHTIFVDQVVYSFQKRKAVLQLLEEHITENIIKIGADFYKQKVGIPQGSVLSTLLCSFFYADLEKHKLGYVNNADNILLRFVDDFLFVSANKAHAIEFLRTMNQGHSEYGAFISHEKTLVNFDISLDGIERVAKVETAEFPWCGYLIDTSRLHVSADLSRYTASHVGDTLTVEYSRRPGNTFIYKMLQAAKSKSHLIFNDTSFNSITGVYTNVYQNFLITAMKYHTYLRSWGTDPKKRPKFFLNAIEQAAHYSYIALRNRAQGAVTRNMEVSCLVQHNCVVWLGKHAFLAILSRKPALYGPLLRDLQRDLASTRYQTARAKVSGLAARLLRQSQDVLDDVCY